MSVIKGDFVFVVDLVKVVLDVYILVSGMVVEVNDVLESEFELVNSDVEKVGWLFCVMLFDL